jgi:hypothetical protein
VPGIETYGYPIVWDPVRRRFVIIEASTVRLLEPTGGGTFRSVELPAPTAFNARSSRALWFDPKLGGFATGLAGYDIFTYAQNRWIAAEQPFARRERYDFAWAYDLARGQLAIWGGADGYRSEEPFGEVSFLTGTSTNASPTAWRASAINPPRPRYFPTMVHDEDRQVTVMFGGYRTNDSRVIAPEIYQLLPEPSWPMLHGAIDLAAVKPRGISRIHLLVRARAVGDADGTGRGTNTGGGFIVRLWDHRASRWVTVHDREEDPAAAINTHAIDVTESAERYVSAQGVLPIVVQARAPATEAVDGRLDVDMIDGFLELHSRVAVP